MTFAMITPALIVGGLVERMKFSALLLFVVLWGTFVYFPMAHMVWFSEGYPFTLGALDFAGGRSSTSTPVSRRWSAPSCSASASATARS